MSNAPGSLLEEISTHWSLIRQAHPRHGSAESAAEARNALVLRYKDAIWWYVRAIARADDDATHDITQQVFLQLLSGKCRHAGERPGRFRDYLKEVIRNEVRRYSNQERRRAAGPLDAVPEPVTEVAESPAELEEVAMWRQKILDRAFAALEDFQRRHRDNAYHTLLSLRREFPDDTNARLAERLFECRHAPSTPFADSGACHTSAADSEACHTSAATRSPLRNGAVRAQLMRAREKFVELLVAEVADTLDDPTPQRIHDELAVLGLVEYIWQRLPPEMK